MTVLEGFRRYLSENDFSSRHISETRCIERKIKRYIEAKADERNGELRNVP